MKIRVAKGYEYTMINGNRKKLMTETQTKLKENRGRQSNGKEGEFKLKM